MGPAGITEWGRERVGDLADLVAAGLPGEELSADELLAVCWDDPGVVLGADGGAVAAVVRGEGDGAAGWIRLLVVHPGARRQGLGRRLVDAAEAWCVAAGARSLHAGGSAPFYLWPGIDVAWTAGLCLAEATGFRPVGLALDLSCPTTFRSPVPDGVDLRRLIDGDDAAAAMAWAGAHWPHWVAELRRGIEQGGAFGAFDAGGGPGDHGGASAVLGFACHSVNRAGWVGPMATRAPGVPGPAGRGVPGTGSALLGALCRDLMAAGYPDAHVAWVSNVSFYARAAGASVARTYQLVAKALG